MKFKNSTSTNFLGKKSKFLPFAVLSAQMLYQNISYLAY